jgi:pyruvate-formate lyase-activating enzyme
MSSNPTLINALVADSAGEIFELPGYAAAGMGGPAQVPLTLNRTAAMPFGSELMMLPDRVPVLYNRAARAMEAVADNPYAPDEPIFPVAVFNSPGYVASRVCAYEEREGAEPLPLFSYGAVGWAKGRFRSAAVRVDFEPRQDLRKMPPEGVAAGVARMRDKMPENRLRAHLEKCALTYGCPAGKNFFLGRYEAPLPTARRCNARCLGCLSLQTESDISCSQDRIAFTPTPAEIAEVALAHIGRVKKAVVSFGQGCEGDPLLAADVVAPAIRRIRGATGQGTINLNSNASRPAALERIIDAGLDSLRVSLNSVRPAAYTAYFRPAGYRYEDVVESIDLALSRGVFVSINLLNMAGVTDAPEEADALAAFLADHRIGMIQWRNLNYDPLRYWAAMAKAVPLGPPIGLRELLEGIRAGFPDLRFGYFNPPKEKYRRRPGR